MLTMGFFLDALYQVDGVSLYSTYAESCYHDRVSDLVKCFSASVLLYKFSSLACWYGVMLTWFLKVVSALYHRNKPHLANVTLFIYCQILFSDILLRIFKLNMSLFMKSIVLYFILSLVSISG